MIPASELIKRHGKEKFIQIATHCRSNEKTGHDKTKGIKGRVRFRMCHHGTWIIDNYEPKNCVKCVPERQTKAKDFKPYFNAGLGGWVESRSDERQSARALGLTEAG